MNMTSKVDLLEKRARGLRRLAQWPRPAKWAIVLLFAAVITVATTISVAAQTPTVDYDTDDDGFIGIDNLEQLNAVRWDLDGDGTVDDTANASDYSAAFPNPVTGMGCPSTGCTGYELTADLNFADSRWDRGQGDGMGWEPIGTYDPEDSTTNLVNSTRFTATFEGNGRTIRNLYINRNQYGVGLFGVVGADGDIRDLILTGGIVTGSHFSGGLAGINLGVISYIRSGVTVDGANFLGGLVGNNAGTITDSHATGSVTGYNFPFSPDRIVYANDVGGLVGRNYGEINGSIATGDVLAGRNAGGLVGSNRAAYGGTGTIRDSIATGNVTAQNHLVQGVNTQTDPCDLYNAPSSIGGLVGYNLDGTVRNSYATGDVLGQTAGKPCLYLRVGGLIGMNYGGAISDSFAEGDVAGELLYAGGLVGFNVGSDDNAAVIQTSYATGDVTGELQYAGGLVGWHGFQSEHGATIRACYATGNVIGKEPSRATGGLVGVNYQRSVMASYAIGFVSAAGGVPDSQNPDQFRTIEVGGLIGIDVAGVVSDNYWDLEASSMEVGIGSDDADDNGTIDGSETVTPGVAGKTTEELQTPTNANAYSPGSIYAAWNLDLDNDRTGDDPWDFGTASQYPVLRVDFDGDGDIDDDVTRQRSYLDGIVRPLSATDLEATAVTGRSVSLQWRLPQQPAGVTITDIEVLQLQPGNRLTAATLSRNATAYTVSDLELDTEYGFRIRLITSEGFPIDSSTLVVRTLAGLPAPRSFNALWLTRAGNPPALYNKTQSTITVSWFVVKDAAGYKVEYRKDGESDWSEVNGYFDHLPSTTRGHRPIAVATGLDCDTKYRFRVSAKGDNTTYADDYGDYAYTRARTGPCALPDRVTNVLATLEPQCADLSWTPPSGDQQPSGYQVQRYFYDTANEALETIEEDTGSAAATYRDCSQEYQDHVGRVTYYITALGTDDYTVSATSILRKGSFEQPAPPRNARLTQDTQFVRRLEWEQALEAWRTSVLAGREGRMRNIVVPDLWPTWYQVERREFAYDQFDERYFPDDSDWEVMRSAGDENTSRSYTDNEDRGSRLYVYRVIPHNSAGAALDFFGDWSFDGPTYTRTLDNVQGDDQQQDPAPTVASASINSSPGADGTYAIGDMVEATVTFSEAVNVTGSPRLTLSIGGQSRTASYARGSGTTALVFAHTVQEGDQGGVSIGASAVSLNGGSINAVDDAQAATLTHAAVTASGHTVDGVRPALGSAAVNGAILTLAYGEALDGNSIPSPGAFTVSVAGAARSVSSVSVSGSQVSLTLAPAVENGDSVTVSYTAPTANLLRDQAGNAAASFSGRTVTNDTEAATDDTAGGGDATPLTASLETTPEAHDGETPFTFELRFSQEFELSYKTLRDHAFTAVGGVVEKAKRLEKGSNIGWRITVQPNSNADVTITLPATEDCGDSGAICTADGRKLSNELALTVSGPGQ